MASTEVAGEATQDPIARKPLPRWTRLRFFLRMWLIKAGLSLLMKAMRAFRSITGSKTNPTLTKRYTVRPTLVNRIFVPTTAQPGQKFPLLMFIHGGGFAIGEPSMDDTLNRHLADDHGFVVVSINYRKAPVNRFPVCVHDCAEIVRAVLADHHESLPVDRTAPVSLGGYSAGGNLALAVAQLPGIKEHIRSLVPVYPVVDFTGKYKGPMRPLPDGKADPLSDIAPVFNWAYIPVGQDLADPLLSPIYASRELLPQRTFFITAEYDYLSYEAHTMARKLAGIESEENVKEEDGALCWEENKVKFRRVPGVIHGWTHMSKRGEEETRRRKGLDELYKEIADWCKQ